MIHTPGITESERQSSDKGKVLLKLGLEPLTIETIGYHLTRPNSERTSNNSGVRISIPSLRLEV